MGASPRFVILTLHNPARGCVRPFGPFRVECRFLPRGGEGSVNLNSCPRPLGERVASGVSRVRGSVTFSSSFTLVFGFNCGFLRRLAFIV